MRWTLTIIFLMLLQPLFGQKILQMEKYGKAKTKKYYIGDDLIYRIKGDKDWYEGTINDLLVDDNIILFGNRAVRLEEITAIKSVKMARKSRRLGNQLFIFGGSWVFWSLVGTTVGWELTALTIIVPAVAVGVGFLIKILFKKRIYKLGKKRRLRMLDLTMKPVFGP